MKRGIEEEESTSPLERFKKTIKKSVFNYDGLRETLTTFQPFIERLREFGGTFRDFIPYRISIPPEESPPEELHQRYNKRPDVLLLAPKPKMNRHKTPIHIGPDLVFVINMHGVTCVNVCTRYNEGVMKTIEGMNITFLERVPCGVPNLAFNYNRYLIREMKEIVDEDRTKKDFPTILQRKLRKYIWDEEMVDPKGLEKQYKNDPGFKEFANEEGWRIVGRMEQDRYHFLERIYTIEDDTFSNYMSVTVLYAKPDSPFTIGTNILKSDRLTRSDLFQIVKGTGHKNIVVLDTSCGGFPFLNRTQENELTSYYKAIGLAGGKRKRKRKTKRRCKKVNTRV